MNDNYVRFTIKRPRHLMQYTLDGSDQNVYEMVEAFKEFLLGCGYYPETVEKLLGERYD